MGFWGDRDDEYMDEDERRLLRESLKRRKEAERQNRLDKNSRYADYDMSKFGPVHKAEDGCEADHTDDGGRDYSATANDDGCHADHSDDGYKGGHNHAPVAPSPMTTMSPTSPMAPARPMTSKSDGTSVFKTVRNVMIGMFVIPFIVMFVIGVIMSIIPDEETPKPVNKKPIIVINSSDDSEYDEKMLKKSQEILDEIMDIDYTIMSRKQLYSFIDETFPYQLEDEDFALCASEVLELFDYKDHAYNCLITEFADEEITDAKKDLHKRGFKGTEIEYAVAKLESANGGN